MLNLDNDEAGKIFVDPGLVEVIGFLLLNDVVTRYVEALTEIRLEIGIGRLCPESTKIIRKMTVKDHQWITRLRMLPEPFRKQHVSAQVHVLAPEFGQ